LFELNHQHFEEIVRNFNATKNRRVAIDFEHASEQAPTDGNIPTEGAPAQGWILDLAIRADGTLWGLVEWLPKARDYIRSGQYRFFSPAVVFNSRDRVTGQVIGARLSSGALTNKPFLDGMAPLAAKHADGAVVTMGVSLYGSHEVMPVIKRALGLPELCTGKECMSALRTLEQMHSASKGQGMFQGVPTSAYVGALRDSLRMPMGAELSDMFKLARKMCRAAMAEMNEAMDDEDEDESPAAAMSEATTNNHHEETNMDHVKLLSEAQARVATLTDSLTAAQGQVSELTLKLTASEKEVTALTERAEKAEKLVEETLAKEVEAKVDAAILTYAESKGATADQRPHLLAWAKQNPAGFDAMYPPVPAHKQHMLRTLSTGGTQAKGNALSPNGGTPPSGEQKSITIEQMVEMTMNETGCDVDAAYVIVGNKIKAAQAAKGK
jgi:phage I-like protein